MNEFKVLLKPTHARAQVVSPRNRHRSLLRTHHQRLSDHARLGFFGSPGRWTPPAAVRLPEDLDSMKFKIPALLLAEPSDVPRQCDSPTHQDCLIQLFRDQQFARIRKGDVTSVKEVIDVRR